MNNQSKPENQTLCCSNCLHFNDSKNDYGERWAFCEFYGVEIPKIPDLACAKRNSLVRHLTRDGVVIKAMQLTKIPHIKDMLNSRSIVGVEKYGVTLEEANLSKYRLSQHALEELTDCANYLVAADDVELARKAVELAELVYMKMDRLQTVTID